MLSQTHIRRETIEVEDKASQSSEDCVLWGAVSGGFQKATSGWPEVLNHAFGPRTLSAIAVALSATSQMLYITSGPAVLTLPSGDDLCARAYR